MPKTVRTIACCYCDASTLVDLARIGRGVLTCDACGARLCSSRMEAVMNKPIPIRHDPTRRVCGGWGGNTPSGAPGGTLDPRWHGKAGSFAKPSTSAAPPQPKKKSKSRSKPKKRKSFLDRLEDIWDEIEDIID